MGFSNDAKTVAIIDGNSLTHRAFHAVQTPMTAPDGTPTNACFGFFSMFVKLAQDFKPDVIVCAFDKGRPRFRMELIEAYKAQRPPTDPSLKAQFPIIQRLLGSMSIPVVMCEGWEGDDVLGTLAAQAEDQNFNVYLVTGDRDAMQLVTERTHVLRNMTGMSDIKEYSPSVVQEEFGVTPKQITDYYGLKGDTSDNYPGVPGIGEKTARALIQEYGTLEAVIEAAEAGDIKGKKGENIRENKEMAYTSRLVATISRDVPVTLNFAEHIFPAFDAESVNEAFGELKLYSPLRKILQLIDAKPSDVSLDEDAGASGEKFTEVELRYEPTIEDPQAKDALSQAIEAGDWISVSIDTSSADSLFPEEVLWIGLPQGFVRVKEEDIEHVLVELVEKGKIAALDVHKLLSRIYPLDSSVPAAIDINQIDSSRIFDCSLAAYLLDAGRRDYSISYLAERFFGEDIEDALEDNSVALIEASVLRELVPVLRDCLDKDGSAWCFNNIELPLIPVLLEMERAGAFVDVAFLRDLRVKTQESIDKYRTDIFNCVGEEFNVDSPMQLSTVLFDKLGLPAPKKKTRTGYSTNAEVLQNLVETTAHPVPALVLEYRNLAKIQSTYIDALPAMIANDGRVHTSYNQYVTATGRLSSTSPNLQNIPVRTDFGRLIRQAFVPQEEGNLILSADYSQIELRLLAHLSGDQGLIDAFNSGADFHAQTASAVFGVPVEEITPSQRSHAKAVNFGIVYGQQAFGLAKSLHISNKEASEMISRYFRAYPQVRQFLDTTVDEAKENGYAITMFGRKRHIPEFASKIAAQRSFGERTAMNHPMQGSAADIIKLAMIEVASRIRESNLHVKTILQVHDELDFEVAAEDVDALTALVKDAMQNVVELSVPLEVQVAVGSNWAEAK